MAAGNGAIEPDLPTELGRLASLIDEKPEAFASGDKDIHDAALLAAKYIFDLTLKAESRARPHLKDLLESIGPAQAPQTRAQTRSALQDEKKRAASLNNTILNETPLSSLFVDGMDDEQIWAQLELKAKNVCDTLEETFEAGGVDEQRMLDSSEDEDTSEEDELDSDELEQLEDMHGLDIGGWIMDEDDGGSEDKDEDESESAEEENLEERVTELRDESSEEEDVEEEDRHLDLDARPSGGPHLSRRGRGTKHAELDDGFFSLTDFNAEIEEAEAKNVSRGSLSRISDDEESEEDNEIDYFTSLDARNQAGVDVREVRYDDFFDPLSRSNRPPKRKAEPLAPESMKRSKVRFNEQVKVRTIKPKGKGLPLSSADLWAEDALKNGDEEGDSMDEESEGDERSESASERYGSESNLHSESSTENLEPGREAIERLKDDLFADDDNDSEAASKSGLSSHGARMESLRKQIAELEAENVAEKDWVLKGEVTSRARPQNALLEEDLEFERVTKAVPVVTDDIVQDLETRIKARIIEGRFDDVVRKRPVDDKPFLPSQVFELQDTKSKDSLAQIYENEYIATHTGGTTDDRDARLKKEHEEIEKQWESICYKLDALCNSHFTPKQPKATIATVSNVSAISLESPLPTARAASTVLAPEEVYKPDTSDLRSKSELTPAEKQALRTKERKKKKKQRQLLEKGVDKFAKANRVKGVKKQKEDAMKSLVKTGKGVTIIGKKGQELKKGKRQTQK